MEFPPHGICGRSSLLCVAAAHFPGCGKAEETGGRRAGAPAEAAVPQSHLSLRAAGLQRDAGRLEMSLGGSWGGQCEPQMWLKLCLV